MNLVGGGGGDRLFYVFEQANAHLDGRRGYEPTTD